MEADWEFQIGGDAPAIDAHWPRIVDLRSSPERAWQLPEAAQFPALAETLAKLNAPASTVWTSKCDFWPHLEADEFDAEEMDAPPGCAAHAMGCYIDILPRENKRWELPELASAACKPVCSLLRTVPLRRSRIDLVIRCAVITPGRTDFGVTAYLTSCGATEDDAAVALLAALAAFAGALCGQSTVE